jgi:hypothetical protein
MDNHTAIAVSQETSIAGPITIKIKRNKRRRTQSPSSRADPLSAAHSVIERKLGETERIFRSLQKALVILNY